MGKAGGDKAIPAKCLVLFIPLINQEEEAFSSPGLGREALERGTGDMVEGFEVPFLLCASCAIPFGKGFWV